MNAPWMNQRVQRPQRARPFRNTVSSFLVGVLCTFPIAEVANAEVVGPPAWPIQAAQDTIRGRVTEEGTGQPVADVVVEVPGAGVQTVTNAQGDYLVEAPSDGQLLFSRLGYRAQTVEIGGQSRVDVTLAVSAASLEEIVVVGYQTQRRADITSAVSSVDIDDLDQQSSSSALQRLSGAAPGVDRKSVV